MSSLGLDKLKQICSCMFSQLGGSILSNTEKLRNNFFKKLMVFKQINFLDKVLILYLSTKKVIKKFLKLGLKEINLDKVRIMMETVLEHSSDYSYHQKWSYVYYSMMNMGS